MGDVIDRRYRVVASLAAGGMGEVFNVEHVTLGKRFALKVMLSGLDANAELVERFKLEAMAASRIGHPNIVDVVDLGRSAEGVVYFVMEYLEGRTLTRLCETEGPQTPKRTVELGLQIAQALAAAHEQQIVHRDLKPENVMLVDRPGAADFVKVLDFGLARIVMNEQSLGNTAVGRRVGTPAYMAPEQAKGRVADVRTDVYALGLILHELLTGRPTFTGESPHMVMLAQVEAPPPPLPPTVPPELVQLVDSMLRKDPGDRPQTMQGVVWALERVRASLTEPSLSRGARWGLAAAGAVAVAVAAVVLLSPGEDPPASAPPPTPIVLKAPPIAEARPVSPPAPEPASAPEPAPEPASKPKPSPSREPPQRLLQKANAAHASHDFRTALDLAERCVAEAPQVVECHLAAGNAAAALHDVPAARRHYFKFMELAPAHHPKRKRVAHILSAYFGDEARP